MDVIDHEQDQPRISDVAVEPATGLTKSSLDLRALGQCDARQPIRRMLAKMFDRLDADRLFDGFEDAANVISRLLWPQQDVDVFRHPRRTSIGSLELLLLPDLDRPVGRDQQHDPGHEASSVRLPRSRILQAQNPRGS
jgi:hypothetical protein